ncbi:MADS-box domain-containing protein [Lachancea thermotolerans]
MSDTGVDDKELSAGPQPQPQQKERRKIEIKFIQDKTRRHITFSKRKHGIMKKAYELSVLTGTQVLLLVVSETGLVYTFTTPKFQPIVTQPEGKNLIQACLNAPEEDEDAEEEEDDDEDADDDDDAAKLPSAHQQVPMAGAPPQQHGQQPHHQQQQQVQQHAHAHAHAHAQQHPHQQQQQQQQQPPQAAAAAAYGNPAAAYLSADQAAVYQQYFNGVNPQQGQY